MAGTKNRRIVLASRPTAMPTEENFRFEDAEIPSPAAGEVLVRTLYLSVDPYMRGRMNDRKSYAPPFAVGSVITGGAVGEVIESQDERFKAGETVAGLLGWQLYSAVKADQLVKVDLGIAPATTALGVLGMTGLTAYFGLLDIGKPRAGETIVVSGAAGAVGSVVCQIAKMKGCRVVALAGSSEKIRYLKDELGVDAAINYRSTAEIKQEVSDACPSGVDIYFDNVGGSISDAVIPLINRDARIVICGQISLYNLERPDVGPRIQPYLLINSALMKGFIVGDYQARFPEAMNELRGWFSEGKLKYAETVVDGFENTPRAFLALFEGENLGKQLVRVS